MQNPTEGILNIMNGIIQPDEVNMDQTLEIGEMVMKTFVLSWPTGFNAPISKEVNTMQLMKKHVDVGATKASESTLTGQLQDETSNQHTDRDNSLNIDGSAVLWFVPWPTNGNVHDCVDKEGSDFDHQEG